MKWIRQQNQAVMKSVAIELILLLVLSLAAPAFAAYESGQIGPYNVSFDMNTTMEYRVIVEAPTHGVSTGIDFTRYNLTVDSTDYDAYLTLTRYEQPMPADISANMGIVLAALQGAGADQPTIYQNITIDAKPAVLGNFRFERQFIGQGQYQEGELIVAAIYSPDASVHEDGVYRGRTDCRVISTFPWEIIRDLLYTLHVEVPKEEGVPFDQSSSINQS
jgi:hypothetical protein